MTNLAGHILGRYRLMQPIGHGGMATVFQAHDAVKNRIVAVKVLSPAMAQHPQFSRRFKREAGVVTQLKHPHIVPIVDFGETAGYAYLVMPFLKQSLMDRLDLGPLMPLEGARVMEQITSALAFAHGQGVVHRDMKPSNILMDEEGNALLADFGLAHISDASLSLTGSALLGTPTYISPEQARGDKVDARSDQYSLGIVLFQLVTGKVPYEADTPLAVLVKHVNDPLPLPSQMNPNVPEIMERVILKATAKSPDDRFDSVTEMNQAFQEALAHAVDPDSNPAPVIDYPTCETTLAGEEQALPEPDESEPPPPARRHWSRLAWLAALLLLLALACPIASSSVLGILEGAANPVAGGQLTTADMSADQLTALAGTIEALSSRPSQTPRVQWQTVVVTSTVLSLATQPATTATPTAAATATQWGASSNPSPAPTRYIYPTAAPTRTNPPPPPPTATSKPKKPAPSATPGSQGQTPNPPTNTPKPPTATPKPPTNTPKPPTNTPRPPTATPRPPTATPIPPYP